MITTNKAKKEIKEFLDNNNLQYDKLTARTISFSDLARGSCIFVKIHGWKPHELWGNMKMFAISKGFRIE